MDQSTPGPPVSLCLPELGQIHVGRFDDTVQPSHPLSSPSPFAFILSQGLHGLHGQKQILSVGGHKHEFGMLLGGILSIITRVVKVLGELYTKPL